MEELKDILEPSEDTEDDILISQEEIEKPKDKVDCDTALHEGWVNRIYKGSTIDLEYNDASIQESLSQSHDTKKWASQIGSFGSVLSKIRICIKLDQSESPSIKIGSAALLMDEEDEDEDEQDDEFSTVKGYDFPLKYWLLEAIVKNKTQVALGLIEQYKELQISAPLALEFHSYLKDHLVCAAWLHRHEILVPLMKVCHYPVEALEGKASTTLIASRLKLYSDFVGVESQHRATNQPQLFYNPLTLCAKPLFQESEDQRVNRLACLDLFLPLGLANNIDSSMKTPLMYAAKHQCEESVKRLIPLSNLLLKVSDMAASGHTCNQDKQEWNFNALTFAIESGNPNIVRLLIPNMPAEVVAESVWSQGRNQKRVEAYKTGLMRACELGFEEVVKILIPISPQAFRDHNLEGALSMAISNGHYHLKELLLNDQSVKPQFNAINSEFDMNQDDALKHHPLVTSLKQNHMFWMKKAACVVSDHENRDEAVADWIKGKKAQQMAFIQEALDGLPSEMSIGMFLALAIEEEQWEAADILMNSGRALTGNQNANHLGPHFNMNRYEGATPLISAAEKNRLDLLERLYPLSNPLDTNRRGHDAFEIALFCDKLEAAIWLLEKNPSWIDRLKEPTTTYKMVLFNSHRCLNHWKDILNFSRIEPTRVTESWMQRPLIFNAIIEKNKEAFDVLLPVCDLTEVDELGNNVFMSAAIHSQLEMMESLIKHGFKDFEARNHYGLTAPLEWLRAADPQNLASTLAEGRLKKIQQLLMIYCNLEKESLHGLSFQQYAVGRRIVNAKNTWNNPKFMQEVAAQREALAIASAIDEVRQASKEPLPERKSRRL